MKNGKEYHIYSCNDITNDKKDRTLSIVVNQIEMMCIPCTVQESKRP